MGFIAMEKPTILGRSLYFSEHLEQIRVNIARAWKAKCLIFKAIVAGFRGKVA